MTEDIYRDISRDRTDYAGSNLLTDLFTITAVFTDTCRANCSFTLFECAFHPSGASVEEIVW